MDPNIICILWCVESGCSSEEDLIVMVAQSTCTWSDTFLHSLSTTVKYVAKSEWQHFKIHWTKRSFINKLKLELLICVILLIWSRKDDEINNEPSLMSPWWKSIPSCNNYTAREKVSHYNSFWLNSGVSIITNGESIVTEHKTVSPT